MVDMLGIIAFGAGSAEGSPDEASSVATLDCLVAYFVGGAEVAGLAGCGALKYFSNAISKYINSSPLELWTPVT